MNEKFYNQLHAEGVLSDESLARVKADRGFMLFSLHWEIRTLLYTGVVLLAAGLGALIYQNIDTIGHRIILLLIALICICSFYYCFKFKLPFSSQKVNAPNSWFDYLLLLGCLSLLTFIGYLQFQYKVFGTAYGLATFIPMLILFLAAYYFDHLGVLSMAIANLALWMGVSVTSRQLLVNNDFDSGTIINTYIILALVLILAAFLTQRAGFKKHFKFSYQHYGVHIAYITLLAGYFHYYDSGLALLWMAGLFLLSVLLYLDAVSNKSFYFLLLFTLYTYFAVSCLAVRLFMSISAADTGTFALMMLYFIGSAIGLIFLLIHFNRQIKAA
jgi:hypothetical protein